MSLDDLLAAQVGCYRAVAPEYFEHVIAAAGGDELMAAVDAFRPAGDVLELACGPGTWTPRLLRHAHTVIVKVPHEPDELERRLTRLGWDIAVNSSGVFFWGQGNIRSPT